MSETKHSTYILVVDDEDIVVSLVRDALEDEGYHIDTASNGTSALKIITENQIDLLITDIRMSPMDGIELSRRAREFSPDLNIIFMTGYANLNSAKDAIKHGAVDYILKPFELAEIRQSVAKAVEKIQQAATQKNSASQLDRLTDLSQMLYEVGDCKSLVRISLRFAMIQFEATCGSILYWNSSRTDFRLISIENGQTSETTLIEQPLVEVLSHLDASQFHQPLMIESLDDHPLGHLATNPEIGCTLFPEWQQDDKMQIVAIPVSRTDSLYGIFTLGVVKGTVDVEPANLKLMSIMASQLALSLENVFLLEETQTAYSRLKQLQDETIQLEKMAARGEISAEIGHELNNFLGVVAGNLSLLEFQMQKQNYDQLSKYTTVMNENIEKIKKFTANLMDLRPIASQKEIISVNQLLAEVIDYLRPQKRFSGVDIQFQPSGQDILFKADSTHVQQLLYNLLNNAADATADRPTREIKVSLHPEPIGQAFVLAIEDTGVGIDKELLQKAFVEKFTTKPTGHGFGLLVCKRIIDGHDGKLTVNSVKDQGTSISIEFPMARIDKPITAGV